MAEKPGSSDNFVEDVMKKTQNKTNKSVGLVE